MLPSTCSRYTVSSYWLRNVPLQAPIGLLKNEDFNWPKLTHHSNIVVAGIFSGDLLFNNDGEFLLAYYDLPRAFHWLMTCSGSCWLIKVAHCEIRVILLVNLFRQTWNLCRSSRGPARRANSSSAKSNQGK